VIKHQHSQEEIALICLEPKTAQQVESSPGRLSAGRFCTVPFALESWSAHDSRPQDVLYSTVGASLCDRERALVL